MSSTPCPALPPDRQDESACKYVIDFYYDGGVPRLMENLQTIMLETDAMTVTAHTLAENIASHKYRYPATGLVNHTMDDPFGYTGGVAVLRGNLAPDTGITKPGAFDKSLHHFEARPSALTPRKRLRRPSWPARSATGMWWSSGTRTQGRPGHAGDVQGHEVPVWPGAQQDHGADHRRPVLRHQQQRLGTLSPEAAEGNPSPSSMMATGSSSTLKAAGWT